jgi:DNA-directed RNA polymerase subunit L
MDKVIAKIITLNKCSGDYSNSNIEIELTGITFHYANMLRRVLKTYIPTYSFPIEQIKITKNSCVIDADQIRQRLANLPIMYINNNEDTVKHFLDYYDGKSEKDNFFTMFVSYKNKTGKLVMVTTDMAKFYYLGKEIKSPYKKPFLFVKLNNNEEFECTCEAKIGLNLEGVYKNAAIYDPVAACAYEQLEENKFILRYESKQQFDEREILRRGLSCLIMRLEFLNNLVNEKIGVDQQREGILEIPNEDMTLGGILGYIIQNHKDSEYCGDDQSNISMRNLQIRYKTKSNITDIFNECVDNLIMSLKSIARQLKVDLIEI